MGSLAVQWSQVIFDLMPNKLE